MEVLSIIRVLLLVGLVSAVVIPDYAEAAQASVSYLHGDGYASRDDTRNTVRLDALAVKDWGMVYGRADIASFDDANSSVFTRGYRSLWSWIPYCSASTESSKN